eukprot:Sdes_comp19803_c0_seq2m11923
MSSKVDLKVVLLGKEGSGKTSLVERFLHHRFVSVHQATVGAAFGAKSVEVTNSRGQLTSITLGVWDTAGSERYEAMSRIYYRGAGAAIICYDITDKESFQRCKFWVTELVGNEENCAIYICGTKRDLVEKDRQNRAVDYHEAQEWSEKIHGHFYETSSKDAFNTEELFTDIAKNYLWSPHYEANMKKRDLEAKNIIITSSSAHKSPGNSSSDASYSGCC